MAAKQKFYFSDGPYLQTLQGLHAALSVPEAFIKLMGNARSGKSALCEKLSKYLRRKGFSVIYFQAAIESPDMLRSMLSRELDLPDSSNFPRLLEDALRDKHDKPLILIFDDAHLLTDVTLLEIYRLAEVQVESKRVLNIVLSGEPVLEKRLLSNKEFKSLLLNVSHRFVLEPMDGDALGQFFYKYVEFSGLPGLQLDSSAMSYFYKSCKGYPGPAQDMCRLMVEARIGETSMSPIDRSELVTIFKAAASNQTLPSGNTQESNRNSALFPLAAVVLIASVGFLFQQVGSGDRENNSELAVNAIPQSIRPDSQPAVPEASPFSESELVPDVAAEESQALEAEVQAESTIEVASVIPVPENAPAPVSDSNLALVTAQERGVSTNVIVEPEFEPLAESSTEENLLAAIPSAVVEPEAESAAEVMSESSALTAEPETEVGPAASTEVAETLVLETETVEVDLPSPAAANTEELAVSAETTAAVVRAELEAPVAEATAVAKTNEIAAAEMEAVAEDSVLPDIAELRAAVSHWVSVWEQQSLDEYFASYHSGFVPRYQDTQAAWRSNRRRVIGNAEWIRLEMSEFSLLGKEGEMIEVQLWLSYESPTYSDNTLKKLLLLEEEGEWRIMEEINLQVRS